MSIKSDTSNLHFGETPAFNSSKIAKGINLNPNDRMRSQTMRQGPNQDIRVSDPYVEPTDEVFSEFRDQ
jgi:hypothetical protein